MNNPIHIDALLSTYDSAAHQVQCFARYFDNEELDSGIHHNMWLDLVLARDEGDQNISEAASTVADSLKFYLSIGYYDLCPENVGILKHTIASLNHVSVSIEEGLAYC